MSFRLLCLASYDCICRYSLDLKTIIPLESAPQNARDKRRFSDVVAE